MTDVIRHASAADDESIAYLAQVLASSGRVNNQRRGSCDLASTGGPSSLSTLLCPLFLRAFGYVVPKVGVPGRPAGAVDVLATIPGYKTELSNAEFEATLNKTGFSHAMAGDDLAPLDGNLFALRKQLDAVEITPLVISSLLAKKIAVGVEQILLDVRVWEHGNFGRDYCEARENAEKFCRVADLIGIRATCILTDASRLYQPFIGRGESLLALNATLYGDADPWMDRHIDQCFRIAASASSSFTPRPDREQLQAAFEVHIEAQGASYEAFRNRVAEVASEATTIVQSESSGFVGTDIRLIRKLLVNRQVLEEQQGKLFSDPAGLRLLVDVDDYVTQGTPILEIRHGNRQNMSAVIGGIKQAFSILPEPSRSPRFDEIIRST